jgi:3-deoxy-manno-octulosonate cytidylyltransferase (CMP-KDO synthetase)
LKKNFSIVIPARLKSSRFPNKLFVKILDLPMIEHVRRRALLVKNIDNVFIASSDLRILNYIKKNGGKVIKTNKRHFNGTSRAAEAAKNIKSKYIIILQADEPLIDPNEIELFVKFINKSSGSFFNCIGKIKKSEKDDLSVVKSIIKNGEIISNFRSIENKNILEKTQIYKLFGLIGFNRKALMNLNNKPRTDNEKKYKIEQMKIIDHKLIIKSFLIKGTLTSVNYKKDMIKVKQELKKNKLQIKILKKILT